MVTVLRGDGLRVAIYLNDHEPAHVHVIGDGEAKVAIGGRRPVLVWSRGLSDADLRRAMRLVRDNLALLRAKWSEYHG